MARRSREHRQEIPGYDESRPTREERKQQHRATRHATNQMLNILKDPEEVVLPEERRTRTEENGNANGGGNGNDQPKKRRYRVWKTKFWKRRDHYRDQKAEIDSNWPVITPDQLS
ncbi:MAG TPA: hypothetical protein VE569_11865 [Acidimicrobiia bacterium]|jgi:hypothetical protein|nr:hypothetical protein [Acidimicrobiia bacterium]